MTGKRTLAANLRKFSGPVEYHCAFPEDPRATRWETVT